MGVLGKALQERLANIPSWDLLDVHIFAKGNPTGETVSAISLADSSEPVSRHDLIERIRSRAATRHGKILAALDAIPNPAHGMAGMSAQIADPSAASARPIAQLWITNSIAAQMTPAAVQALSTHPDIASIEILRRAPISELIDEATPAASTPTASGGALTWSVTKINAPLLWSKGLTGEGVVVAVIDTGVNYKHPDLASRMWKNPADGSPGYNFSTGTNDPWDEDGHGTSCAGIVAGTGALGTATGVAPGATILALHPGDSESSFWEAFQFAIDNGVDVISMSMTWKYTRGPNYVGWRRAADTIFAAGLLHANSSGNQGAEPVTYPVPWNVGAPGNSPPPLGPAGRSAVISCGSVDSSDQLALTSAIGPCAWEDEQFPTSYRDYLWQNGAEAGLIKPDVCAPGEGSTSTNFQYGTVAGASAYSGFGGTSAATPHVAGALALLVQACKRSGKPVDAAKMQEALEQTAVKVVGQTGGKQASFGAGRIDVFGAFNYGEQKGWWA
jgi:subtilisin family serine protease